jgi:hypothetical protein
VWPLYGVTHDDRRRYLKQLLQINDALFQLYKSLTDTTSARRRLAGTRILDKNASRDVKRKDVAAHQFNEMDNIAYRRRRYGRYAGANIEIP